MSFVSKLCAIALASGTPRIVDGLKISAFSSASSSSGSNTNEPKDGERLNPSATLAAIVGGADNQGVWVGLLDPKSRLTLGCIDKEHEEQCRRERDKIAVLVESIRNPLAAGSARALALAQLEMFPPGMLVPHVLILLEILSCGDSSESVADFARRVLMQLPPAALDAHAVESVVAMLSSSNSSDSLDSFLGELLEKVSPGMLVPHVLESLAILSCDDSSASDDNKASSVLTHLPPAALVATLSSGNSSDSLLSSLFEFLEELPPAKLAPHVSDFLAILSCGNRSESVARFTLSLLMRVSPDAVDAHDVAKVVAMLSSSVAMLSSSNNSFLLYVFDLLEQLPLDMLATHVADVVAILSSGDGSGSRWRLCLLLNKLSADKLAPHVAALVAMLSSGDMFPSSLFLGALLEKLSEDTLAPYISDFIKIGSSSGDSSIWARRLWVQLSPAALDAHVAALVAMLSSGDSEVVHSACVVLEKLSLDKLVPHVSDLVAILSSGNGHWEAVPFARDMLKKLSPDKLLPEAS